MPTTHTPSVDRLKRALQLMEQIQELESEVASLLGGSPERSEPASTTHLAHKPASASAPAKRGRKRGGKRFVSAEARAKMAAAQRARWARFHKGK